MGKLDIPPADTLSPELLEAAAHAASLQGRNVHTYAKGLYQRDTLETGSMRDQFARDEWSQRQGAQAAEMQARRELRNSKDALEKARFQDDLAQKHERAGNAAAAEEARENAVGLRAVAEVATERARRAQAEVSKMHEDADGSGREKVTMEAQLTQQGRRSSDLEATADRLDDRARNLRDAANQRRQAVDADKEATTLRANGDTAGADAKAREAQAANQRANSAAAKAAAIDVDTTVIDQANQWGVVPDPADAKPEAGKLDENGIDQSKIEIEPNDTTGTPAADGDAKAPAEEQAPKDGDVKAPADGKAPAEGQLDENGIDQSKIEIEPNDTTGTPAADGDAKAPAEEQAPKDGDAEAPSSGTDETPPKAEEQPAEAAPKAEEPPAGASEETAPQGEEQPAPGQLDANGIDQSKIELEPEASAEPPSEVGQDGDLADDVLGTGPITSPRQVDPSLGFEEEAGSFAGNDADQGFDGGGQASEAASFDAEPATASGGDQGGFSGDAGGDLGSFDDESGGFDGGGEVVMASVGDEGSDFAE